MMRYLGIFLIFVGLVMCAGASGDCDGRCMELANTMDEFVRNIVIGLFFVIVGGMIIYKTENGYE